MFSIITTKIFRLYALAALLLFAAFGMGAAKAQGAANLYITPASGSYQQGGAFSVVVYANTAGESVNAVELAMTYPDSLLTFSGFSASGSGFEIEAPGASGGSGTISMVRASVSGKTGTAVNVVTLNFTAKSTNGTAALAFGSASSMLRTSDSANVLGTTSGGSYSIFTNSGGSPPPPPPAPAPTPVPTPSPSSTPTTTSPTPSPSTPSPTPSTNPTGQAEGAPNPTEQQSEQPNGVETGNETDNADGSEAASEAPNLEKSMAPATMVGLVAAAGFVVLLIGYGIKKFSSLKAARRGSVSNVITSAGMSSVPLTKSGTITQTKKRVDELLTEIPDPGVPKPNVGTNGTLQAGTVLQPSKSTNELKDKS